MPGHDIIVIGASAGGVEALRELVHTLPPSLPATLCVVLHLSPDAPSRMPAILNHSGPLKAVHAVDGMFLEHSRIYVAPPDHHLLLDEGLVRVIRGPKENRHRPAVDPLFRSAALAYGPRVIGVILTGALDDGTAGLLAVKSRGGLAVVQDPQEALYSGMPQSALNHVQVDYCVPLAQIAPLLVRLVHEPAPDEAAFPITDDLLKEVSIAKMDRTTLDAGEPSGIPSEYSCPECGGVLWQVDDGVLQRYRCRVGHAFTTENMQAAQQDRLEEALWSALKTLQESANLSRRLAHQARQRGHDFLAKSLEQKMLQAEQRANIIREALLEQNITPDTEEQSG